ncbi:MAG: putative transporter protein [Devosia sp.]|uniref:MFS transporter n=1 Tax=Devosia sp. TaxID=1871048 RepID=UPI002625B20F|nr:MFS transporter [Devosia sp.]MDB5527115.1 putative transporter protein [Devosia sp.]
MANADVMGKPPSALKQVLGSRLYLGATIAMLLSGIGTSAAAPQIVLYLAREFATPLPIAGLFYLTSLAAPVAGYLIGSYSDRTGKRLGLFRLCVIAGFLGWAGIAIAWQAWMPFVISTLVLGFSGAAASQLFAAIHDDLTRKPTPAAEDIVAIIRMALTVGWVVGPVIGAWFAAEAGIRVMFWGTALCFLAQIIPLGTLNVEAPPAQRAVNSASASTMPSQWTVMTPLLVFTGLYILVYAGEAIKYGFLLVYMEEQLHLEPALRGAIIGIQPLIELIIMPFSVIVARRIGTLWLMTIAAGLGVLANLCFALWPSAAGMFAGQILMGGVWGVFAALGIIVAQRLLPSAVATASAIFMSSTALSSALGGITGGLGIAVVGLPMVFLFPAAYAALATVGLAIMARRAAT